jgi:hypothetical protein
MDASIGYLRLRAIALALRAGGAQLRLAMQKIVRGIAEFMRPTKDQALKDCFIG